MMKKKVSVLLLSLIILLFTATCVHVSAPGTLRIDPYWPEMSGPSELFKVWVEGSGSAHEPALFLVMTGTCYSGLTSIVIDFGNDGTDDVTLVPGDFSGPDTNDIKKIPDDAEEGIKYTVASLKDHLGVGGTSESIYWALVDFPSSVVITGTKYPIWIELDASSPKMLVYVFAKTAPGLVKYNLKVPPTIPGFIVPEPATIAAVATPMIALIAYTFYRRKTISF